ncbi:retrovirus-related pol polyprotein from transposon TNT 1-94 [Tanacetum coccineum]
MLSRNKARLVAQGHTQEEGIDYDEVKLQWLDIEAIKNLSKLMLIIRVLEDPDHPDKILKSCDSIKWTIHQAPQLCHKGAPMLVQIYVDDIIFGSTKKELCEEFEKLMKDKFQMSSMGELTFFLGLQVQQKKKGIFISQDKYVHEILKKFNYTDVKSASTPTDLERPLVKDADADDVDEHLYRSMIGSLMYLTASRPDIMFAVCACASWNDQRWEETSHPSDAEIFAQLALMGYATDSDKLTFQKGAFSPQWRPQKGMFNFSRMIFDHMVSNISSPYKFLMYPRFVISDTEIGEDDSSKQGRKFSNEGVQDDEGVQEKASTETELFIQEVTPTEVIHEQEGSGKASDEVSTLLDKEKVLLVRKVQQYSTADVNTLDC